MTDLEILERAALDLEEQAKAARAAYNAERIAQHPVKS